MTTLAYHITWTTYGTWLPGDRRGWIKKYISGIQPAAPAIEQESRQNMKGEMILLSPSQRMLVEKQSANIAKFAVGRFTP
jgi:hypothetical protein